MKRIIAFAAGVIVVSSLSMSSEIPPTSAVSRLALHCGHLFDSNTGKLLGETTIVTDGTRIKEVKPGRTETGGIQTIDLGDETCLPGLIDAHTHLTDQTSPTGYT